MSRFLRLQIYNADNTQVEFDNATDTFWGIVIGTARLDRKIMQSELKFGELLANMLQIQVFGLDKNINLKNRKVVLSLRYDKKVYSHLVDDNGDYIVDSDGDRLLLSAPDIVDTEKALFTGYIDTSTMDTIKTDRTLIAYDKSYIFRDIDIATWWNTYWEAHENDNITIATFRNSLLNAFNIQYEPKVLINDDAIITNWLINVTTLKLGTILSQLCEVQCCCPNVNADEILEFVTLGSTTHDLTSNLEGLNSIWKDFTTELVTGVAVYDTSKNLAQLVGTDSNVYNLAGNVFVLSMNTQQINSVGANILNAINTIQYTPCSLNLVTSDVEHNLGDSIITPNGNSYILTQTYSGSLLINEQIISPATKPTLNAEVNSINDEFIEGQKRAKIEQNIDEFYTEYTNYANNTSSRISQMSDRVVVKVDSNGNIGLAELGADPDTGVTHIQLNANSVDINSDTIQFNNEGYRVTGPIFTSSIQPDKHETICDYSEIIDKSYFPHIDFNNTKAFEQLCSYAHLKSTITQQERILAYNCYVISSFNILSEVLAGGINDSLSSFRVVIGRHMVLSRNSYTQFIADGGRILDDGHIVMPSGKYYTAYFTDSMYMSLMPNYSAGPGGPNIATIAYLNAIDMVPPTAQSIWDEVGGNGALVCVNPSLSLSENGF